MHLFYPNTRLRRNKKHGWSRELFAESHVKPSDLIMPVFIKEGGTEAIESMPGISVLSVDDCVRNVAAAYEAGIRAVMLFPRIAQERKDAMGSYALSKDSVVCKAIEQIKKTVPEIGIIVDIALDPYTTHGHDGVLDEDGFVDNDKTIEILAQQSLVMADVGCDVVSPSDMMDGRISAVRNALENNRFYNIQIFSYSAKYASKLYAPFRNAIKSVGCLGNTDKKHYQLDPGNSLDAIRKTKMDLEEGADSIIVKPAMFYLDIVKEIKNRHQTNVIVYQVSGEYSSLKIAAMNGVYDYRDVQMEFLLSCKRAGASCIITYDALNLAKVLISNRVD